MKEDLNFQNALYKSNGGNGKSWLRILSLILMLFAGIVLVWFYKSNLPNALAGIIVCYVLLGLGAALYLAGCIIQKVRSQKPVFILFETHMLIYAKDGKKYNFIPIAYADILKYKFGAYQLYVSDGDSVFESNRTYFDCDYGYLYLKTQEKNYKVQIADIAAAREWLIKLVEVPESANEAED